MEINYDEDKVNEVIDVSIQNETIGADDEETTLTEEQPLSQDSYVYTFPKFDYNNPSTLSPVYGPPLRPVIDVDTPPRHPSPPPSPPTLTHPTQMQSNNSTPT